MVLLFYAYDVSNSMFEKSIGIPFKLRFKIL
jgi:hypothetical protein